MNKLIVSTLPIVGLLGMIGTAAAGRTFSPSSIDENINRKRMLYPSQ